MTVPIAHTAVVGALVRSAAGDILLVRHPQRGWEIPQGRVEEGEDLVTALRREVREEAGVEIVLGPLAAIWSKLTPPPGLVFNFLAEHAGGEPRPCVECPEVGWFTPEAARQAVTHPVNRERLTLLLDHHGELAYRAYTTAPYQVILDAKFGQCPALTPSPPAPGTE